MRSLKYESYKGSLRGTRGTLWSEAGNSTDKASLLIAMLRGSGIPSRYLTGLLDLSTTQSLISSMFDVPAGVEGFVSADTILSDPINDSKLIAETQDHWWVQAYINGVWVDMDPIFANATLNQTFVTGVTNIYAEVPDNFRHKVDVSVKVEEHHPLNFGGGSPGLSYSIPLAHTFNSVELIGRPLTLQHLTSNEFQGGAIFYYARNTYTPYLILGEYEATFEGNPFQELISNFPFGTFLVTAEWLVFTLRDIDSNISSHTYEIFDSVGASLRQTGGSTAVTIDSTSMQPKLTDLDSITALIAPSRTDSNFAAQALSDLTTSMTGLYTEYNEIAALLETIGDANPSPEQESQLKPIREEMRRFLLKYNRARLLTYASADDILAELGNAALLRTYSASPRLMLAGYQFDIDASQESVEVHNTFDLLHDVFRVLPAPGQNIDAGRGFQAALGMLQTHTERTINERIFGIQGISASAIFEAADAQNIEYKIISSDNLNELRTLPLSSEAVSRITHDVQNGFLVIVPSRMVQFQGEETIAWWRVDQETGHTVDVLENGKHGFVEDILTSTIGRLLGGTLLAIVVVKLIDIFIGEFLENLLVVDLPIVGDVPLWHGLELLITAAIAVAVSLGWVNIQLLAVALYAAFVAAPIAMLIVLLLFLLALFLFVVFAGVLGRLGGELGESWGSGGDPTSTPTPPSPTSTPTATSTPPPPTNTPTPTFTPTSPPIPSPTVSGPIVHVVSSGNTLFNIAVTYNFIYNPGQETSMSDIIRENPCTTPGADFSICNPNTLYIGQRILIPLRPGISGSLLPNDYQVAIAKETTIRSNGKASYIGKKANRYLDAPSDALSGVFAEGVVPITETAILPLPNFLIMVPNTYANNVATAIYNGVATFTETLLMADIQTEHAVVAGYLASQWQNSAQTGVAYTAFSAASAIVRLPDGTFLDSGLVTGWSETPEQIALSGTGIDYVVDGWARLSSYAPALTGLGIAPDWSGYVVTATATSFIPTNVQVDTLSVDGILYGYGEYIIEINSAILIWGNGASLMPAFINEWQSIVNEASIHLSPGIGIASIGDVILDTNQGVAVNGFDGVITFTEHTTTSDRIQLTGVVDQLMFLDITPSNNSTIPFQSISFQIDILSNLTDTYYLEISGPEGWEVDLDSSGLVTVTPGVNIATPGDYVFLVKAQSLHHPELIVSDTHIVTIIPNQGMELNVAPNLQVAVPVGSTYLNIPSGIANNGQLQLSEASFTIALTNTSTVSHTFLVQITGLPNDWLLVDGSKGQTQTTITLPPGGVSNIGLYVEPTLPLPGPGTSYPFNVTATAVDNPSLTQTDTDVFTIPAIAFNYVTAAPQRIYVAPDTPATFDLAVKNVGNTGGTFPITVTLPFTLWSSSYVNTTGLLPAGDIHAQTVSFTPVGAVVGSNSTMRIDSPAPGTAYTQSTFVRVAVRSQETVCAYEALQMAPDMDAGLVAAMNNLLTQLELWTTLNDLAQRDRAVAAIRSIVTQLEAYPGLAVTGQLEAIAAQMSGHTDSVDLANDRTALGVILCQDLKPALALIASYNPAFTIFPAVQATVPGRTITTTLTVVNYGDSPATAEFTLSNVPAGWTVPTPTTLALQPGVSQQLALPITPDGLGTESFAITMRLLEAPTLAVTRTMSVRVVSELLAITNVTLDPAFLNVGTGTTDVSIQLANPAGLRAATIADVQLTDATGVVRKAVSTPFTVAVNNSGPFFLGELDIDGLEQGVYTATVRLVDLDGSFIPHAVGSTFLAIGQDLQVLYDRTPSLAAPGQPDIIVSTVITTQRTDVPTTTVPFTPTVKWSRSTFSTPTNYNQVVSMPAVGDINLDGIPDVVFSTYRSGNPNSDGVLRVVSGDDGSEIFSVSNSSWRVMPLSSPIIVDLENDGIPEIVIERNVGGLIAFDNTGNAKYISSAFMNPSYGSLPVVADMNGDGLPEIVVGRYIVNNTLSVVTDLGSGSSPGGGTAAAMTSIVGDVNLDGSLEVIAGNAIYSRLGGIIAQNPLLPAISLLGLGNFDNDLEAEIVVVDPFGSRVFLVDHQMNIIWGPVPIPLTGSAAFGNGGAPTIADFDGDGELEIGIAGASDYVVYNADGTILWQDTDVDDSSSGVTGSSVFDFQGDGRAEVVYADQRYLKVYNGSDGSLLFRVAHSSSTAFELPVIADVDGDGHAEIIVSQNNDFVGSFNGIRVFEAEDDSWVNTRQLWYQHAYDITTLTDNAQVVTNPTPVWLLYNTFRSQASTSTQGNTYFIDIHHGLPLLGASLLTDTVAPLPLGITASEIHWLYSQQDRQGQKVVQLSQILTSALQPGEVRQLSTGTVINYTRNNNATVLLIPPLYVTAPHIISITPELQVVSPGDTAVYTVTLTNAFSTTQTITFDVLGVDAGWVSMPITVTLTAGEIATLPLLVTVPAGTAVFDYDLLVRALLDDGGEDVTSAVLSVQEGPQLTVTPPLQFVRHGAMVTYTVTLTNTTSRAEQYTFTTNGLESLPVGLPAAVNLAPGEAATGVLTVTAQSNQGVIPFVVQAVGVTGLSAGDEAGLGLLTGPNVAATLSPAIAPAGRGAPAVYTLTVTNSGSMADTYTFSANLPAGWSYELLANGLFVSDLPLTPYIFNSADLRLLVTPAMTTTPAIYPVQLVVTSQSNPGTTAVATAQAAVAAQGVQVSITPQAATMSPVGSHTWDVTVTNTGEAADTFTLAAGGVVAATAQFAPPTVTLGPGASTVVQLTANNLDFALPTTYPFAVTAQSTTNPDVFNFDDATVTFTGFEDVAISITPTLKVIDGFVSEHQFLMVITNTGNVSTLYNLSGLVSPAGDVFIEIGDVYIPAHMTGAILVRVIVPSAGTYNITVQATSASGPAADSAVATLIINSLNTDPVAVADSAITDEDTAVTIPVLANDSDADGDTLTVTGVTQPAHGLATTDGTAVTYTPNANYHGSDSFTYTINDGQGGSDTATVTITVNPVNDDPTAVNDVATTDEDTPVTILVLANDSDVDGDTLTITGVTQPTNGAVTHTGSDVTYTPDADYHGPDSFTYTVSDGNGGTATATVSVSVTPVNDDPVAMDDAITTPEDTAVTIPVLANDIDVDGDALAVTAVTTPTHGIVTLNLDNTITYTPTIGYNGLDSFTYTITDGNGGSDIATVTVTVSAVNENPVAVDDQATTDEDTAVTIPVLDNDTDGDGDTLTVASVTLAAHGVVTTNGVTVTYTPNANYYGVDSFSYTVSDGNGGSDMATVTVTVNPVNDAPVAVDDAATTDEDTAVTIDVLANDSDVDGDTLTVASVTQPAHGVVVNNGGSVTYTPDANYYSADSFTYTVSDGQGGSDTATVVITVNPVNDAPVANDDAATTPEDTAVTIPVLTNDTDLDGDALIVASVTQATHGLVVNNGSSVTYTPNANYYGADSFTYTVSDGNGGSAAATVTITVTPVNDPPVAVADEASTLEDTPVIIAVLANDSDVDGDTLAVNSVTQPGNGTVVINPDNTVTYTPDPDFNSTDSFSGTDTFTYTVSDGQGGLAAALVTVTVIPVNDAPVANDDVASTPEDTAVTVNVLANDSDVENDPLTVVSVTAPGNGVAAINVDNSITYTPTTNFNGSDSFAYTISDGNGGADTATVTINVTAQNDAPVAVADNVTTAEDTAVTLNVLANDSDVDGDTLTVTNVTTPTYGAVVINPDSTVTYTPLLNYNGLDSFSYTVSDGQGGSAVALVTITITPVNDAPLALDDSVTTAEDTAVTIDVLSNDSDVDGDVLTVVSVTQPVNGSVVINLDNTLTYTPAADFNGVDSFSYTISDGAANAVAAVTITVSPVNDAPAAVDDVVTTPEDTAVTIAVLANDSDVDGDPLVIDSITQPANGSAVINPDNTITYTPAADYHGLDSFSYTVSDGQGGSDTAVVSITITPVNDDPAAADDAVLTPENTAVTINVLANDSDVDGDALTVISVTTPTFGSVVINPDSSVTYTPATSFNGLDNFSYTISDGNGGTATATVFITVSAENDNPVANDDAALTAEDTPVMIDVLANDTDIDGDSLTVVGVTQPTHGSVVINPDNTVTYTPQANYYGGDSFTYTISDGQGGSDTAIVTVTITPVNDAPVANDDSATTAEDTAVIIDVLVNDSDIDGDSLTVISVTPPSHGSAVINPDNTITYTPAANFYGSDMFTYMVSDGNGGFDMARVDVIVMPVNDAPVAAADDATTAEDTAVTIDVLANDSDVDGDTLTVTAVTSPGHGSVVINPDGSVTYTPNANYYGSDSFSYTISDGAGSSATAVVTITITPVNDAPAAVADSATTPEDTAVTLNVLANDSDVDGDTLTVIHVTQPGNGTAVINPDSSVTYTPDPDFNSSDSFTGADVFTYTVSDGNGGLALATVTITVTPVNDDPVALADSAVTDEDTSVIIPALDNDWDVDGDVLTVTAVTAPLYGSVVINPDNTITYTPDANFNGMDSFAYTISDGQGGVAAATVTVAVNPVNDAPTAADDAATTVEDTAVTVYVLANDSDVDGDTLSVTAVTPPAQGTATINADNSITYTPNADYNGTDSFNYTVSDGAGGVDTATVTITVTPVNDAPVANDDSVTTAENVGVTIDVLANDTDVDGDALTVSGVTQPVNGAVVINADNSVTYTPAAGFSGLDSFSYTVDDSNGGSDTATVTVTITAGNENPVANDDNATTAEDTAVTIPVLDNDSDGDGDVLTVVSVTQPTHGAVVVNPDSTVMYTPHANYYGADSFNYTISDGRGGSDSATVSVTVTPVNDAPVAQDDSATTPQETAVIIPVLVNDSDVDGDTLTIVSVTQPTHGVVTHTGSDVTYTPAAGYSGSDNFSYTMSDGHGGSDSATVSITVTPVAGACNLYPIALHTGTLVGVVVGDVLPDIFNGSGPGNFGWLSWTGQKDVPTLVASLTPPGNSHTYINPYNLDDHEVSPGDWVRGKPGVSNAREVRDALDLLLTLDIIVPVWDAASGAGGMMAYQVSDFAVVRLLDYQLPQQDRITVQFLGYTTCASSNANPAAGNDAVAAEQGAPMVIDVLANDTDADGDALVVAAVSTPGHGTAVINPDNTITYESNVGFVGTDSFIYVIADGHGGSANATVTVSVTPVAAACELYPIALHSSILDGVPVNGFVKHIENGTAPGEFGWLSWTGSTSVSALATSLTPPGDSHTYVNPFLPDDHVVSVTDWVGGKPGVSNDKQLRDALNALQSLGTITVPIWDATSGSGADLRYQVSAFANVRLMAYQLPNNDRISIQFLGYTVCQDSGNNLAAGQGAVVMEDDTAVAVNVPSQSSAPFGGVVAPTSVTTPALGGAVISQNGMYAHIPAPNFGSPIPSPTRFTIALMV
ncbi:MAG: tandem-95 repeat protein [Anaerolinea sp.]|nr:tandem-95 repeat protein [Anaerolinea sp.]